MLENEALMRGRSKNISGEQVVTVENGDLRRDALRGRLLVEESREVLVLVDDEDRVIHSSRRARETFPDLAEGRRLPGPLRDGRRGTELLEIPYEVEGRTERLVYLSRRGDMHAYEELRAGFTAAVSHELRTPLARLLALFESLELPDPDIAKIVERARGEIGQMGELIDDVLFLGELETGHEVVGLGATPALAVLRDVAAELGERAEMGGMSISVSGDADLQVGIRPRMLRVLALNLVENAIRYAGTGSTLDLSVRRKRGQIHIKATDTGAGVAPEALPRLFERFYRADAARASRGTGLGLAIVKHICASANGHAFAEHTNPHGLTIRLVLPDATPPG